MTNEEAKIVIGNMPIKPEVLDDCYSITEYQEAKTIAIKALEQQSCEDCISRQEAISAIIDEYYPNAIAIDIVDTIANLPSVTPKAKMGRWIDIQYFKNDDTYYRPKCPFCSTEPKEYSNYCPGCGAKMQEVEE